MGDEILRLEYRGHAIQAALMDNDTKLWFNGEDICKALGLRPSLLEFGDYAAGSNNCRTVICTKWLNYKGVLALTARVEARDRANAFIIWFVEELMRLILRVVKAKQIKHFDVVASNKFYL